MRLVFGTSTLEVLKLRLAEVDMIYRDALILNLKPERGR
jgi:hypothetical protein